VRQEVEVTCPKCGGTGKIKHTCRLDKCDVLKTLYETSGTYSYKSMTIRKCPVCGQLYKVRAQWDDGTGRDDIWMKPGESERGYMFTIEEAKEFGYKDETVPLPRGGCEVPEGTPLCAPGG
jgi:uncharacterized Zn finger protein